MLIYDALIASHLGYCNISWASAYKTILEPLYIIQKRALKIALRLPRITNSNDVFKQAVRLSVYDLCEYQSSVFIYSVLNHIAPPVFDDFFILTENVHSHATRSQGGLHAVLAHKNVRKVSLKTRSVQLWASITTNLKSVTSLNVFKNKLKYE